MTESIEETVLRTIQQHDLLKGRRNIVIGVSGGPDSVCLLHVLANLRETLGIELTAAHLEHGLRGAESVADSEYVRELCENLHISFVLRSADIAKSAADAKISLETAGRIERYAFFREVAGMENGAMVAVAHNRNDQVETILMNLFRGTGLEGLTGMSYLSGGIIRPLLDIDRKDIEKYCETHDLRPRTDRTNLDAIYTRNRIRNVVLPAIDSIPGTDIKKSLIRMSEILTADNEFLNAASNEAADGIVSLLPGGSAVIDIEKFKLLHPAIARRIVRIALTLLNGDLTGMEAQHIERVAHLARKGRSGTYVELPRGITAHRLYGNVVLSAKEAICAMEADETEYGLSVDKDMQLKGMTIRPAILKIGSGLSMDDIIGRNGTDPSQYFDLEKLGEGVVIRHRRKGDIFRQINGPGEKKLNDYFTDKKIPGSERDRIFLLASGSEIAWIIGYNISNVFKVGDGTMSVLKLEVEKK